MADEKKTVIVASKLPTALQINNRPATETAAGPRDEAGPAPQTRQQAEPAEPWKSADISGERGPETAGGWGITHGVDPELFDAWMKAHPEHKDLMKVVSEDELKKMVEDEKADYGFEVGLKQAEAAAKEQGAGKPAAHAPAAHGAHPAAPPKTP